MAMLPVGRIRPSGLRLGSVSTTRSGPRTWCLGLEAEQFAPRSTTSHPPLSPPPHPAPPHTAPAACTKECAPLHGSAPMRAPRTAAATTVVALALPLLASAAITIASVASATSSTAAPRSAPATLRWALSLGDHMVLQQAPERAVVWGFAATGAAVKVTFNGHAIAATADASTGQWRATLPATPASTAKAYTITASSGGATITLDDVLFGDVWVCSGQSNMAFLVENAFNGSTAVQAANNYPHIRLFTTKKQPSAVPVPDLPAPPELPWSVASNVSISDDGKLARSHAAATATSTRGGVAYPSIDSPLDDNWLYMSATCWFTGVQMFDAFKGKVPIGLVNTNWGGTSINLWADEATVKRCYGDHRDTAGGDGAGRDDADGEDTAADAVVALPATAPGDAAADGTEAPMAAPKDSELYQGMILPLTNMTIRGALWWQGEADSNAGAAGKYFCMFTGMIARWRADWSASTDTSATFPFGNAQLSVWSDKAPLVNGSVPSAEVRWAQTGNMGYLPNAALPNVFGAVTVDLGDPSSPYSDVHIRDKSEVGRRLGLAARAVAYGQDVYWTGPIVASAVQKGSRSAGAGAGTAADDDTTVEVEVTFRDAGAGGIEVRSAAGFQVSAGTPGQPVTAWVYADAPVVASTSTSVTVGVPTAALRATAGGGSGGAVASLRYQWQQNACEPLKGRGMCTVYAKTEGLPAAPFRVNVTQSRQT